MFRPARYRLDPDGGGRPQGHPHKPGGAPPSPRLAKGQKADKKRMAEVAAAFTRAGEMTPRDTSGSKTCSVDDARADVTAK